MLLGTLIHWSSLLHTRTGSLSQTSESLFLCAQNGNYIGLHVTTFQEERMKRCSERKSPVGVKCSQLGKGKGSITICEFHRVSKDRVRPLSLGLWSNWAIWLYRSRAEVVFWESSNCDTLFFTVVLHSAVNDLCFCKTLENLMCNVCFFCGRSKSNSSSYHPNTRIIMLYSTGTTSTGTNTEQINTQRTLSRSFMYRLFTGQYRIASGQSKNQGPLIKLVTNR